MTKTDLIAIFFGMLAALMLGSGSVAVRYLTTDLHGMQIAVFRLVIACTVIFAVLRFSGRRVDILRIDRYQLLAIVGFSLNYVCFHFGLEQTTATNAIVLENTAPFFVLLILAVAGVEKVRVWDALATFLALVGVYFTVRHDFEVGSVGEIGDFWEIGAAVAWAIFIIGSARSVRNTRYAMDRVEVLFKILLPCVFILSPSLWFYPLNAKATDIYVLLLVGLLPTTLGYYFWYEAMAIVSTLTSALLFVLSVVFTFVVSFIALGEELTIGMLVGAVFIMTAVVLPNVIQKPAEKPAGENTGGMDGLQE